jgi:hypothetical protein
MQAAQNAHLLIVVIYTHASRHESPQLSTILLRHLPGMLIRSGLGVTEGILILRNALDFRADEFMAILPRAAVSVERGVLLGVCSAADALPAGVRADEFPSSGVVDLATDEHVAGLGADGARLAADAAWGKWPSGGGWRCGG